MVVYWLIAVIVIVLDQWSKRLVVMHMEIGDIIPVWGGFFSLTSHRNPGAAWGILEGQRMFFLIITVIVVIGIIYFMFRVVKQGRKLLPFALALLLGGAIGNFIDRARHGEVVDFFRVVFHFQDIGIPYTYYFPIFNVADSAITFGVILIILDTLLEARREKKQEAEAAGDAVDG